VNVAQKPSKCVLKLIIPNAAMLHLPSLCLEKSSSQWLYMFITVCTQGPFANGGLHTHKKFIFRVFEQYLFAHGDLHIWICTQEVCIQGSVIGHGIGGKYIPIMAHLAKARCWSKR